MRSNTQLIAALAAAGMGSAQTIEETLDAEGITLSDGRHGYVVGEHTAAALKAGGLTNIADSQATFDAIEAHFEKTRATIVADLSAFNPTEVEGRLIKAGLTLLDRVERVLDGRSHVSLQLAEVPIERRTTPEAGPEYDGFVRFYDCSGHDAEGEA